MPKIHLIEKITNLKIVDKEKHIWDSFCWAITEENAKKLIGGDLYLHRAKDKPSHFGGKIISYRVLPDDCDQDQGEVPGRIVFCFQASVEHKDVKAEKGNWTSMEKKIVWD
jgi:hypothetical protein